MKKNFTILSLCVLSFVNAQYDGFNYSTPLDENNWITHSGTEGSIVPLVSKSDVGNSLSFKGLPASVGNRMSLSPIANVSVNKSFSAASSTVVYASFLMKVTDTSSLLENSINTAPAGYFFHFSVNEGKDVNDTGAVSRVGLRKGSSADTYNISLLNTTGGTITFNELFGNNPKDYKVNQTYFVVVKYDMSNDKGKSSIWVDTLNEAEVLHTSEAGTSKKQNEIKSIVFRQRAKFTPTIEIDEVRLGKTWNEVIGSNLATVDSNEKSKAIISNTLVTDQFKVLSNQKTVVSVYSINGQLVKTIEVGAQGAVNVSSLSSGVYIVRIVEGNTIYTQKIIKK